ncbi:MAG: DUF881 domain-containing protein [Clostridium sp.]|nr:DUF881 domain-containing protein [Clostridium sp.]
MKKSIKISLFLVAMMSGLLISLSFNLTSKNLEERADIKEYEVARAKKIELLNSVLEEEEKNKDLIWKLEEYESDEEDSLNVIDELERELSKNKKILGYQDVTGEGYQILLEDGEAKEDEEEDSIGNWLRLIHNEDMLKVLNELKQNGSEAISINGERVLATSEIYCSWAFISINGKKLPAPFVIEVVGDPAKLNAYMNMPFNQLNIMINRGIKVTLEKQDNILLKGSSSPLATNYLKNWKR